MKKNNMKEIISGFRCPTCKSVGFNMSLLGPTRCEFCDGTFGGYPPTDDEISDALDQRVKAARSSNAKGLS